MSDGFPTFPVRVLAGTAFSGVADIEYLVPSGCFLELTGIAVSGLSTTSGSNVLQIQCAGLVIFEFDISSFTRFSFYSVFPPFIAHDGETVAAGVRGDSLCEADVTISGRLTAKRGPIT